MEEVDDNKFMRRCLELGGKAEGMTYPNPMVGSVIVCQGKIIGEGFHLKAGGPHAEVIAINSVSDKAKLSQSTIYVNLEPCSHFGKTPPCSDFIVASAVPRIVIGTIDTSGKVSGKGVAKLKNAGCEVITGVIEEECRNLNRRFFTFTEKGRPYISLKWAESADGYLDYIRSDVRKEEHAWISGKPERILVHKWRASEQAILVGSGTIRSDNPRLNVRDWKGSDPLKLILGSLSETDKEAAVVTSGGRLILFTGRTDSDIPGAVRVILDNDRPASHQIAEYLFGEGIQSLLIEGGYKVLSHFISTGFWDEARIFRGKAFFRAGVKAPVLQGKCISETTFSTSKLEVYLP